MHGFDLYSAAGGLDTCRKLSSAFYAHVERDPLLRPLFPGKSFRCAIEAFAGFLVQFLGGPGEDGQRQWWWLSLRESHLRFKIGQRERDAWMHNMAKALDDVRVEEPVRAALLGLFERSSAYLVNHGDGSRAVERRNEPADDHIHSELARRWDLQRTLDEEVAAVRSGDAHRAIALAESAALQAWFQRDRAILVGLLALMIGSGHTAMLDYVRQKLLRDPALAQERYSGRALLHWASGAGSLNFVELLLHLGANPNATDGGGHTPLYCLANECGGAGGGNVVRALVQRGAGVDAKDGVKHCTALHMAARRGNVEVAEALLDCGADIEARDTLGDTPLRRAVNCNKTGVAALLLSRGADPHSKGSKVLTPFLAARTTSMKQLLQSFAS
jgi:hemoglobin